MLHQQILESCCLKTWLVWSQKMLVEMKHDILQKEHSSIIMKCGWGSFKYNTPHIIMYQTQPLNIYVSSVSIRYGNHYLKYTLNKHIQCYFVYLHITFSSLLNVVHGPLALAPNARSSGVVRAAVPLRGAG